MALLTQAQAVRAARITGTPTADQTTTLTGMIAALNGALEPASGPIEQESRTARFLGYGRTTLQLPWRFASITSITCDGVALSALTYDAVTCAEAGIVVPVRNGSAPWANAYSTTVIAVVGYATVPGNLTYAAELLLQAWWETAWQGRGPASEAMQWQPPADTLPAAVLQAVGAGHAMPGFA
jgi:hypothetical protein